jgi:hypothetical protein
VRQPIAVREAGFSNSNLEVTCNPSVPTVGAGGPRPDAGASGNSSERPLERAILPVLPSSQDVRVIVSVIAAESSEDAYCTSGDGAGPATFFPVVSNSEPWH